MAIYWTDRDRRIRGDRLIGMADAVKAIHAATADVYLLFAIVHAKFEAAVDLRLAEEGEDKEARLARDRKAEAAAKLYAWAWHKVTNLLAPSWEDDPADEADVALVREKFFPLGPVSELKSAQQVLDGTTHLVKAMPRETAITYPQAFVTDTTAARDALDQAQLLVSKEGQETSDAVAAARAARAEWDTHYASLKDSARCYLRLDGQLERMNDFFQHVPHGSGGQTDAEPEVEPETQPSE